MQALVLAALPDQAYGWLAEGAPWLVAWLGTVLVHGLVLGFAALLATRGAWAAARPRFAEIVWRVAVLGPLVTASLQLFGGSASSSAPGGVFAPAGWVVAPIVPIAPLQLAADEAGATELAERDACRRVAGAGLGFVAGSTTATGSPGVRESAGSDSGAPQVSGAAGVGSTALDRGSFAAWPWTVAVAVLWMLCALFGAVRLALGWRTFRRRLLPRPVEPALRAVLDDLLTTSRLAQVELVYSAGVRSPIALGFRRPAIVLPERATTDLEPRELRALLAHELAHVERRDPLWLLGLRTLGIALWFQPLVSVARRRLVAASEDLCDRSAVQRTGLSCELALCLTRVAEWLRAGPDRALLATPLLRRPSQAARGRGDSCSALGRRVERLVHGRTGEARVPGLFPGLSSALCAALCLAPGFAVGCAGSGRQTAEPDPNVPRGEHVGIGNATSSTRERARMLLPGIVEMLEELRAQTRSLIQEATGLGLEAESARLAEIDQRLGALRSRTMDLLTALEQP